MIGKVGAALISVSTILTILVFSWISITSAPTVFAADENLTTNVSVTNAVPVVDTITCNPISDGNFTPNVGADKVLSCWTTLTDDNGYGDLNQSALDTNFYSDTVGGSDDLNTHYSNGTSSNQGTDCTWTGASGTNITVNCSYTIKYYVNPSEAGWTANFSIQDNSGESSSNTLVLGVETTLGLDVKNTSIEYGQLALSGSSQVITNITNWCNQQIDVKLRESQYNGQLYCSEPGSNNITTDNGDTDGIKYNTTSFSWPSGISLTDTSTQYNAFDLNYYDASGTTEGESTKNIYWRIKIPSSGITGVCSGQTEFIAIAG